MRIEFSSLCWGGWGRGEREVSAREEEDDQGSEAAGGEEKDDQGSEDAGGEEGGDQCLGRLVGEEREVLHGEEDHGEEEAQGGEGGERFGVGSRALACPPSAWRIL